MTDPTPCPRAGRWIGGCKFEARYDPGIDTRGIKATGMAAETIAAAKRTVYIHDICIRCGKVVKRD